MKRIVEWFLVLALYFGIVVHFLRAGAPGSFCAYCGPSPGLWWGDQPAPGPREYYGNQTHFDLIFLVPYLVVGVLLTVCGCTLAVAAARRFRTSPVKAASAAGAATLGVMLLAATISDIGARTGLGMATLFLLHGFHTAYTWLTAVPKLFLPAALLSALVAVARVRGFL